MRQNDAMQKDEPSPAGCKEPNFSQRENCPSFPLDKSVPTCVILFLMRRPLLSVIGNQPLLLSSIIVANMLEKRPYHMHITALQSQANNHDRINIFVDDQ